MNEDSKKLFLETDFDSVLFNPLDFKTKLIEMGWYFVQSQINNEGVRTEIYESVQDLRDEDLFTSYFGSTFETSLFEALKKCQEYYQR